MNTYLQNRTIRKFYDWDAIINTYRKTL